MVRGLGESSSVFKSYLAVAERGFRQKPVTRGAPQRPLGFGGHQSG